MNAFTALLMGIIPLTLFVWIGSRIPSGTDGKGTAERWLLFLLGLITTLLGATLIATFFSDRSTAASYFIILPSLWGSFAALFLFLFSKDRVWPYNHLTWALSGVIILLLIGLELAGEPYYLPITLVGSALVALIWRVWSWVKRWMVISFLVLVTLLLLALWSTDTARPLIEDPRWLASVVKAGLAFTPGAAIIAAARIVGAGLGDEGSFYPGRLALALFAVLIILFLIAYQTMLASIWDVATDGLSGIFLVGTTTIAGIASGLLLAWKLTGWRKLAAITFAALVPIIMIRAERMGTLDRNRVWGTLPGQVTESRAEKINREILNFHAEHDAYPQTLSELTPRYLLYIPVPYIIPRQEWCYEGGVDYYRFGYVYREVFSLPASVRLYATEGEPPALTWACEEEAAKYQIFP